MKSIRLLALMIVAGVLAFQPAGAQNLQLALRQLEDGQAKQARPVLAGLAASTPSAENHYYLGLYYLTTGQLDSAKVAFDQGLALNPKAPLLQVGLGELEIARKNLAGAEPFFQQARKLSKNKSAEVFYRIGSAYLRHETKDLKLAIDNLEKAVDLDSKQAPWYVTLGDAYLASNQHSKAVTNYERAQYFDPKLAKAYIRSGDLYKRARDFQNALEKYQAGQVADPEYAPTYDALAEIYFLAKQYDRAATNFAEYMKRVPVTPDDRFRYAGYLYLSGQYDQAIAELQQLGDSYPNPVQHRLLGFSYYELKQFEPGAEQMALFMNRAQADQVMAQDRETYGRLLIAAGRDTMLAIQNLRQVAEEDTSKSSLFREIAGYLYNSKHYAESGAEYEAMAARGIKLNGTDYLNMGKAFYFSQQFGKADSAFAQVNEVAKSSPLGWLWRARANWKMETEENPGLAKPYFEKYIELTAAEPDKYKRELIEANFYLGIYYYQKEDLVQAETYLRAVAALDPEHQNAKTLLEAIAASGGRKSR